MTDIKEVNEIVKIIKTETEEIKEKIDKTNKYLDPSKFELHRDAIQPQLSVEHEFGIDHHRAQSRIKLLISYAGFHLRSNFPAARGRKTQNSRKNRSYQKK